MMFYIIFSLYAAIFLTASSLSVKSHGCKNEPTNSSTLSNCIVNDGKRNTATCKCVGCEETVNVTLMCLTSQWKPKIMQHNKCLECQSAKCWSNYEVSHLACPEIDGTNIHDLGIGSVKHCQCKNNCLPVVLTCEKYGAAKRWIYNSSVCQNTTRGIDVKLQGFDEHLLVTYSAQHFSFACEPGYKLLGTNESICMDGKFKTKPPKCEPISDNCTTKSSRRIGNLMIAFGLFMIFLSIVILFCRYCNHHERHHRTTLRVPVSTSTHKNTKYSKLG